MPASLPTLPPPALRRDPGVIRRLMPVWEWFYRHYFRVRTSGWEHMPSQGQVLLVGSHNGGLATPDLPMFLVDWIRRYGVQRQVYGLTHAKVWKAYPGMAELAARVGAVPFHPRQALAVLRQGHSLLVYPGGGEDAFRPHRLRDRIHFRGRTGFIRLALWQELPVMPLISWGAHDTLVVLEDCTAQARRLHALGMPWLLGLDPEVFPLYLGLPWGLGVGPLPNLPLPAAIHTRVCAPVVFPRTGYEASRDRGYVQACYEQVVAHMQGELDRLAAEASGISRSA
ncbi:MULTISPECIES: lysophospholipid acyltransferase family protein [Aphanothece]|uniref:lysophospholipid acyltransferase family protein n=1 Tax=Aphanothece TaxID=1121 RepID=UPI00398E89E3